MTRGGRKALAVGLTGLGTASLVWIVQGFAEVIKGGSFTAALKEATLTALVVGAGAAGAMAGALALTEACPTGHAIRSGR